MSDRSPFETLGDFARVSTSSAVAAKLTDLIVSGALEPGSFLPPEREFAATLDVSRSTLREAIHELTLKGLITRRQGSGSMVSDQRGVANDLISDLGKQERSEREVLDFRLLYEPEISSLAAQRATETDLVRLQALCDFDPLVVDEQESLELDHLFHLAIAESTHNQLMSALIGAASEWIEDFRRGSHATPEKRALSHGGHGEVLAAIRAGDSGAARRAMRAHLAAVTAS